MSVDLAVALRSSSTTMAYSLLIILMLLLVLVLLVVLMVGVTGVLGMVAALAIASMQIHTVRPFVIWRLTVGHATTTAVALNHLRLVKVHCDIVSLATIVNVLFNSLLMHSREKATSLVLVLMKRRMFGWAVALRASRCSRRIVQFNCNALVITTSVVLLLMVIIISTPVLCKQIWSIMLLLLLLMLLSLLLLLLLEELLLLHTLVLVRHLLYPDLLVHLLLLSKQRVDKLTISARNSPFLLNSEHLHDSSATPRIRYIRKSESVSKVSKWQETGIWNLWLTYL